MLQILCRLVCFVGVQSAQLSHNSPFHGIVIEKRFAENHNLSQFVWHARIHIMSLRVGMGWRTIVCYPLCRNQFRTSQRIVCLMGLKTTTLCTNHSVYKHVLRNSLLVGTRWFRLYLLVVLAS